MYVKETMNDKDITEDHIMTDKFLCETESEGINKRKKCDKDHSINHEKENEKENKKENEEKQNTSHYNKSDSVHIKEKMNDVNRKVGAERLAQRACRFSLNNINLQTIAENTPDIVEFHSELKKAVDNLTTVEVQSIIKNWESQKWPAYEMLTVTSDLDSKDNDEKITNTTDIKPVIFVMIKGAMLKTLVDSGCEKSVINEDVVKSNCWKYDKVQHPIVLNMANGVVEPVFHHMIKPQISSDDFSGKTESLLMAPIKNYDMVLGRDFLIKYKAKIILEHESSDAQESTSNVEDQEHGMIVPGLDIWCEQKLKRVFIPFGKMMKHIKSSYKDVLMTKNQFDKACDNGGKFYLYI